MSRTIPVDIRREIEQRYTGIVLLHFIVIKHRDLSSPIRVVCEGDGDVSYHDGLPVNYKLDGDTYQGFPFMVTWLNDDEKQPRTTLVVPNIDRRIGEAVLSLTSAPSISLAAYVESDWATTYNADNARSPIDTPRKIYGFDFFVLHNIRGNAEQIEGDVEFDEDFTSEPYPFRRATMTDFPSLGR